MVMQRFYHNVNFKMSRMPLTLLFVFAFCEVFSQCALFDVGGGGAITTATTSYAITLSGSQTGTNYQLYRYGVAVGTPVAGTNNPLSWASQSAEGPYTVVATGTGCT